MKKIHSNSFRNKILNNFRKLSTKHKRNAFNPKDKFYNLIIIQLIKSYLINIEQSTNMILTLCHNIPNMFNK